MQLHCSYESNWQYAICTMTLSSMRLSWFHRVFCMGRLLLISTLTWLPTIVSNMFIDDGRASDNVFSEIQIFRFCLYMLGRKEEGVVCYKSRFTRPHSQRTSNFHALASSMQARNPSRDPYTVHEAPLLSTNSKCRPALSSIERAKRPTGCHHWHPYYSSDSERGKLPYIRAAVQPYIRGGRCYSSALRDLSN